MKTISIFLLSVALTNSCAGQAMAPQQELKASTQAAAIDSKTGSRKGGAPAVTAAKPKCTSGDLKVKDDGSLSSADQKCLDAIVATEAASSISFDDWASKNPHAAPCKLKGGEIAFYDSSYDIERSPLSRKLSGIPPCPKEVIKQQKVDSRIVIKK